MDDDDKFAHVKACPDPSTCAVCVFMRNEWKWKAGTRVLRDGENIGSWLVMGKGQGGRLGLGCWVCQQAGVDNEFANATVVSGCLGNIRRHGSSSAEHQEALAKLGLDSVLGAVKDAPSTSEFHQVLNRLDQSLRKGVPDQFGRHKCGQMRYCLAEASRASARTFLAQAKSIAIAQDCRANRLLMRYCAVDEHLNVRRGFLGSCLLYGGETISNLLVHMDTVVTRFFSEGAGGPSPADCNDVQKAHFCQAVSIFVADAASNEQGAGRCSQQLFRMCCQCRRIDRMPFSACFRGRGLQCQN